MSTTDLRAALSMICLACHRTPAAFINALCLGCWGQLSAQTRQRLRQCDHEREQRIFQMLSALRRGVRLGEIRVAA